MGCCGRTSGGYSTSFKINNYMKKTTTKQTSTKSGVSNATQKAVQEGDEIRAKLTKGSSTEQKSSVSKENKEASTASAQTSVKDDQGNLTQTKDGETTKTSESNNL